MVLETDVASGGEREQFRAHGGFAPVPDRSPVPAGHEGPASRLREATVAFAASFLAELETERARGAAFLLLPVLMGIGAFAYYGWRGEPSFSITLTGTLLAGILAVAVRNRPSWLLGATAIFAVWLGFCLAQLEVVRHATPMLGAEITTRLTGRVAVIEQQADGRIRLTLDVVATERPKLRYAPDRVRVTARRIDPSVRPGDGIAGLVKLFPPQGPVRPDSYDFAFQSYFDGRGATGFVMGNLVAVELPGETPWLARGLAMVERARLSLARHIESRVPGERGQIAAALITGIRAGISEDVNEDLRKTGLAHILSISGLHMALVALTIMVTLRTLCAAFPVFASNRPVKKYAAAVALLASAAYLAISGADVAAQRSFIMLGVMLLAVMFDRSALTMRNLAISAIIVLVIAPHEIMGPSFQMSFAATAALIAGYAAWSERKRDRTSAVPQGGFMRRAGRYVFLYTAGLAMTSLLAGGATTLYGIWHFQRASPLALAANLVVMPVVSVLVMPFAVLAAVLMPLGLDAWPLAVMDYGLHIMLVCTHWLAERSPFDETGAIPKSSVVILSVALLIATISTTRLRLLAVPFLLAGMAIIAQRDYPDLLVAEDARLVGLRQPDGALAVNRTRPSGFTTENWRRAIGTDIHRKPRQAGKDIDPATLPDMASPDGQFLCQGDNCVARLPSGGIVAVVRDGILADRFCKQAAILIVQDATATDICAAGNVKVLTMRDLARRGSAEIRFTPQVMAETRNAESTREDAANIRPGMDDLANATPPAIRQLRHSIPEPFRPWHEYRAFSRAARGQPPYERKPRTGEKAAAPAR